MTGRDCRRGASAAGSPETAESTRQHRFGWAGRSGEPAGLYPKALEAAHPDCAASS
jgi:hypothetical protein